MRYTQLFVATIFLAGLISCGPGLPDDVQVAYNALPEKLDYNQHVKPVLSDKCFACHGPDKAKQKAGLRLDMKESAYGQLPENPGKVGIDPGDLAGSELYHRIMSTDPDYIMPTKDSHLSLTVKEKAILVKWIEDGAEYKPHWAFVPPERATPPEVKDKNWIKNPIDYFVLARLEREKMHPSQESGKELLLRRVSLDLTGLPPTLEEIAEFINDKSPDAYEKQVDRLLKSPHYGEKMAVGWLDLARFADSHGYTVDRLRDMSPYRDWVIDAFNKNMPYDKFVQWQLAGDLMPEPTKEMIIATAFNRNHPQNMEGGIVEEEFQTEYVIDRTNTFGDAMLGISVGCAKCHDHKYDPISQKNYYQLFSFFNNVKEAGQISWDDALPTPTLLLPTDRQDKMIRFMNAQVAAVENEVAKAKASAEPDFQKWISDGHYQTLAKENQPISNLQALFSFDKRSLKNIVNPREAGTMKRESGQTGDLPVFLTHDDGHALLMNGDGFLDLGKAGIFSRSEPFSIGIWVNIPANLKEGVILHKSQAERLYNFRGYHLYLKDDRLELNMAHTAPSNAITKLSQKGIPRDRWIQLTITYDGSSQGKGLDLYLDGSKCVMETTMDQLTKDILFKGEKQPGLQIGGWWRGLGLKGGKVDNISIFNRRLTDYEVKILARRNSWAAIAGKARAQISPAELEILRLYYLSAVAPKVLAGVGALTKTRSAQAIAVEDVRELMVMQEMPRPKKAHILLRGNYYSPGEEVSPGTPESIMKFPDNLPKNRYGLSLWLTAKKNPLTARVAVNRFWQNFFGTGLVKTTEDFGNQGELPSHPELLDWLAIFLHDSGWDVKKLNKMMVMSAAYRQDSKTSPDARANDPENRLLARGPSGRMSAEMIRDNALMASGLLATEIGGESVKPYQPEGLWEINNTTYKPDSGQKVYRRSLYVLVKRSVPNPTLATFDAASRSSCIVRRQKTNTPLQALVVLNDPTFIEAAKVMGEKMSRQPDHRLAITTTYRKLTGRTPGVKETDLLLAMQKSEYLKFKKHPQKALGWLGAGQVRIHLTADPALVAANAVVASTIMNSDATLTKR